VNGLPFDTFFATKRFVTLLVIIDPVGSVPLFPAMTRDYQASARVLPGRGLTCHPPRMVASPMVFGPVVR
jgi:hypothetical protein